MTLKMWGFFQSKNLDHNVIQKETSKRKNDDNKSSQRDENNSIRRSKNNGENSKNQKIKNVS